MPASHPSQNTTWVSLSNTPASQQALSRRGAASFTYPDANRAIWPTILAAISAEGPGNTSHSCVEGVSTDSNTWDWNEFFVDLVGDVGMEGLGELLNQQVLDKFLRKYPHAIEMTLDSERRGTFQDGRPPPPAPTLPFDRIRTHHPGPHGAFPGGPSPPAPSASFKLHHHPIPCGSSGDSPPLAPTTMSFLSSPNRPCRPFLGGPPSIMPVTVSLSTLNPSTPRHLPPNILRRAALRATTQDMTLNYGLIGPKLHEMSHYHAL